MNIKRFIGDKNFYKKILLIAVPIMIQNGITNFVSLLDNIMIGKLGTEPMSGASIVNQLFFIYYLCIFGGMSGAGIFTAQYYGHGDDEGIRHTFRFKFFLGIIISFSTFALFTFAGKPLINMYLKSEPNVQNAELTLMYGQKYLKIMLFTLPAFTLSQTYASTLRECGQTFLPMISGGISVFLNLFLNYIFIYGKLGAPALGVEGAAVATVISRYAEFLIIAVVAHKNKAKNTYLTGIYKSFRIPKKLIKSIFIKGTPLLLNETMWASAIALISQCYSQRGLNVVAALNIASSINNVFNIAFIALGDSIAIIVGQYLGANMMDEAKETAYKMIFFSVSVCTVIAAVMAFTSRLFPRLYNTTAEAKDLAQKFILLYALFMPQNAFLHGSYFTLRSGGKTIITFLFDSVFAWCVSYSVAFILSRFTEFSAIKMFIIVQSCDLLKCLVGFLLLKKGIWLNNIIEEKKDRET